MLRYPIFIILAIGFLFELFGMFAAPLTVFAQEGATQYRLVFVSEEDGNAEIFSMDIDGKNRKRLTNTHKDVKNIQPRVAPDGKRIVFVSSRDGADNLYVMDEEGGKTQKITSLIPPYYASSPVWSPDGKRIAYVLSYKDPDGKVRGSDIFSITSEGKENKQILQKRKLASDRIDWHQKQNVILYTAKNPKGGFLTIIIELDNENSESEFKFPGGDSLSCLCFMPDSPNRILCSGSLKNSDQGIFILERNKSENTRITLRIKKVLNRATSDNPVTCPVCSPDGKLVIFNVVQRGIPQIYVMDMIEKKPKSISGAKAAEYDPDWFPVITKGK